MMEINKHQRWIFLGLLLLWFVYALLFTPSGDDWERIHFTAESLADWGRLIADQYQNLNGRVIGNFLSFALIKPLWLRAFTKALAIGIIAVSIWRLAGLRRFTGLVLSLWLITAIPRQIHVQSYAWSAGFFNYVIPLAIVLPLFALWKDGKKVPVWVAFLSGLFGCLFVEHITLFLFLLSGLLFFYLSRMRKNEPILLGFSAGVLIGTLMMAGSPVYYEVAAGTDWYRRIPSDSHSFAMQVFMNCRRMGPYILESQRFPLLLLLLIVTGVLVLHKRWRDLILWAAALVSLGVLFVPRGRISLFQAGIVESSWGMLAVFLSIHFFLWGFLLLRVTPLLPKEDRVAFRIGLISWMVLYAPLTIVQPIGPRNFYAGTIALIFVCLVLVRAFRLDANPKLGKAAILLLCTLLVWRGGFHYSNTKIARQRDGIIRSAMTRGETVIQVPLFPYIHYMHGDQVKGLMFHYYYKEPGDIIFYAE